MAEIKNYETFYSGGYSSLNPDYGNFVGFRLGAGAIGSPTGIQTANQLNEVIARMREGVKNVELQPLQQDVFEQIPKQHFQEMRALMKLSGVKPSVHAPMIDPAGFGEKGYGGDMAREDAERRLFAVVEKSQALDPKGNTPIVIHSSGGVPGREWRPKKDSKPGEEGRFEEFKGIAINQETGQMADLKRERLFRPEHPEDLDIEAKPEEGNILFTPKKRMQAINRGEWENKLTELAQSRKHAGEIMGYPRHLLAEYEDASFEKKKVGNRIIINHGKIIDSKGNILPPIKDKNQIAAYNKMEDANIFLENAELGFNNAFEKAFKYGNKEQRIKLKELAKEYTENRGEIETKVWKPVYQSKLLGEVIQNLEIITRSAPPKTFVPVEEFAMKKAATTFGNLALKSYEKYGKKAPILAMENMYQGFAFSRAEDMKDLVAASKKEFIDQAKKSKRQGGLGLSESKARKHADKVLGVTWDVGHLNIMRKHGFKKEDIVAETKKIAPLVKHIHLTDNFGYSDSHLPPGMGNVPTKEIMEQLEKAGALKDTRAIVEAGAFVQHFKKSPHPFVLSAFGSPIYGAKMAPYWNQVAGVQGNYFEFPMAQMPEKHFSIYGSGFSMLPEELGGMMPGTQSRFTGTPNA